MRRGYYGWDEAELPLDALEARCAVVQAAMRAQNLDGLLLYTNIARPAAVSWLTGFTPYWSEGVLFVPREGVPDFATALSKRVAEWMRAVTPIGSIVNTPQPSAFFGTRLAAAGGAQRLGVLELDAFPTAQATALLAAAPDVELVDATTLFHNVRQRRDPAERMLFAKATALARQSLAGFSAGEADVAHAIGAAEKIARDGRAEDVSVTVATDLAQGVGFLRVDRAGPLGAAFALRLSLAYKCTWVRETRCVSRDPAVAADYARLNAAFAACLRDAETSEGFDARLSQAFADAGAKLSHVTLECCRGSYPLEPFDVSSALALEGSVVSAEATVNGARWIGARAVAADF